MGCSSMQHNYAGMEAVVEEDGSAEEWRGKLAEEEDPGGPSEDAV